jgi:phage terminase small subunit
MPRVAAANSELTAFQHPAAPMEPPSELSEEAAEHWRRLVGSFPRERFREDAVPVLTALCQHMVISRQINTELDALRNAKLNGLSAKDEKVRRMFERLAKQAREEAKLISVLSTKLRCTPQSQSRDTAGVRRRIEAMPAASGPRPWDVGEVPDEKN